MAELSSTTRAGRRQTFERMRDLLHETMDDPELHAGMTVDMARRIDEVLADADATDLDDLDQPPDRSL